MGMRDTKMGGREWAKFALEESDLEGVTEIISTKAVALDGASIDAVPGLMHDTIFA